MGRGGLGRPSKPTSLRILEGDRSDRINRHEPHPGEQPVVPTQELPSYARQVWDRLAPDLVAKGVLTFWDAQVFTTFCAVAGTFREASEQLSAQGLVGRGSAGGEVKSPYWQIMKDCMALMTTLGGRFGLTPADRARLSIGGGDGGGPGSGPERLLS